MATIVKRILVVGSEEEVAIIRQAISDAVFASRRRDVERMSYVEIARMSGEASYTLEINYELNAIIAAKAVLQNVDASIERAKEIGVGYRVIFEDLHEALEAIPEMIQAIFPKEGGNNEQTDQRSAV